MSSPNQPGSFFDSRFVLTMVLVLACWLGWQSYMSKKYPDSYKKTTAANSAATSSEANKNSSVAGETRSATAPETSIDKNSKPEDLLIFDDATWSFQVSSNGMAIKNVQLKKFTDRKDHPVSFAEEKDLSLFGTSLLGRRDPLEFVVKKTSDNEIVGEAHVDGMTVTKILQIDSATYTFHTKVRVENASNSFTGLVTQFSDRVQEVKKGGFMMSMSRFEHQEFYTLHDGTSSRVVVSHDKPQSETYGQTHIAGFGSQYFAAAVIDRSPVMPEFKEVTVADGEHSHALGVLTYNVLNKADQFAIEYVSFAGPKSYDLLKSVDAELTNLVNFGFFMTIAKGIFWLMKTIHAAIGNWGIAIIFLTIIVRLVVLPFNMIGYKQMRAMTKIQPQMKLLRERYKNDPQRLNQEMMALMKESKANPIGGCLPMFFQIPVFFALYQVIGQSIELYKAPFFFWIHDLSLKDPFFVLPILMGVTMYFQQKITPSAMEPAQQKVMMFMPIFFSFLMLSLPSGLTLYIFISSLFGVLQQMYFMKNNSDSPATT